MAVDLRGAEEADVDASALQPVGEHLRHRDDRVGGLGELAVADRERQPLGLRADRAALVDEHAAGRVRAPREVRREARQADPDEADGAVAQPPRRRDGHHLVGRVAVHARHAAASARGCAWYSPTSAVSSTCRCIQARKRLAVAADRVPADVELVVAVVVAVRVRRMRAARRDARPRRRPRPAARSPPGRGSSSSTISSTVTIERADARTVSFCTPRIPQSWTLPVPVGLLRVDDADVRPVRRHRGELLAGERARRPARRACAPARSPPS